MQRLLGVVWVMALACDEPGSQIVLDASVLRDATPLQSDGSGGVDSGWMPDAGPGLDSGSVWDAGTSLDAAPSDASEAATDARVAVDAAVDSGASGDAGAGIDAGVGEDAGGANEPTIWRGQRIVFTKAANADPTSPQAQDRITPRVALTRGAINILFNATQEQRAAPASSPAGTLWSFGTTDDIPNLRFAPFKEAANRRMQDLPGRDMVLHLVEEDIYVDIRWRSWGVGGTSGGGFSYERSTP
ncbi:MAG: hypothetical protein VYB65_10455 [Myxococcota bacterium]|nr:hypothetical protein [Myxococcota bacterium]